jgi:hypothetical protein
MIVGARNEKEDQRVNGEEERKKRVGKTVTTV